MTNPRTSESAGPGGFASPSALREFALETAAQLREAGFAGAGDTLEAAATFAATTGSEWLGELGLATKAILKRFAVPGDLRSSVSRIRTAATSRHPYSS